MKYQDQQHQDLFPLQQQTRPNRRGVPGIPLPEICFISSTVASILSSVDLQRYKPEPELNTLSPYGIMTSSYVCAFIALHLFITVTLFNPLISGFPKSTGIFNF
jgi:hypothetical protein